MSKTFEEINEKIRKGQAVVVTAEEMIGVVEEQGAAQAARQVDVVTTGTFGAMCSSGAFLNIGHTNPRIKVQKAWLNDVAAYAGLAAVDLYIGADEMPEHDPLNTNHPGDFAYGGGHVIHDLVAGLKVRLRAVGYGTDCYPRKELTREITLAQMRDATLCNPRNAYQNYNVATNLSDKTLYTYMGVLKPRMGNINYCSAGQLSPLLNDPYLRTIGIGTRIFLGGGIGYVYWRGTQHNPDPARTPNGVPREGAGSLGTVGDLKQMKPEWLVGVSMWGYGASMMVGIGVPIPILDEEMALFTAVRDRDILAPVVDYGHAYPNMIAEKVAEVDYASLRSGKVTLQGKQIPTGSLSSYAKAREIAQILKGWVKEGSFLLGKPTELLPAVGREDGPRRGS